MALVVGAHYLLVQAAGDKALVLQADSYLGVAKGTVAFDHTPFQISRRGTGAATTWLMHVGFIAAGP